MYPYICKPAIVFNTILNQKIRCIYVTIIFLGSILSCTHYHMGSKISFYSYKETCRFHGQRASFTKSYRKCGSHNSYRQFRRMCDLPRDFTKQHTLIFMPSMQSSEYAYQMHSIMDQGETHMSMLQSRVFIIRFI